MWWWLFALAGAAEPPCYGFAHPNRLEGERFWVEWPDGASDTDQARIVLDAAEHAREVYTGHGWPFTEEAVVIAILKEEGPGISGFAQTVPCADVPVPRIELTIGQWNAQHAAEVTLHEVGHAAQYGYMGDYLDAVASWVWWMEGTASWIETLALDDDESWAQTSGGYLASPWVALHQGPPAYLVPERSDHMYGTAYLARYIEQEHGADAVRATWEWAGPQTGSPLFFPDAIEGIGIDFEPFWARFLAGMTVGDIEGGDALGRRVSAIDVEALPAEGEPATGFFPEGTGISAVHFDAVAGRTGQALEIAFEGDDEVDWIVVIVRTEGFRVGGRVIDYVPLVIDGGDGTGWLSGFGGDVHGWLVASPITRDAGPWRLSWSASLIEDPGPMPEAIAFHGTDGEEEPKACGCATSRAGALPWLVLPFLLARRRRAA